MMISVIDFIFLNFVFSIVVGGIFINYLEHYLPSFIIQLFRYGEFSYKGIKNEFLTLFEIPKSYFKHFYLLSSLYSVGALLFLLTSYSVQSGYNANAAYYLDFLCGFDRKPVCRFASLTAMSLLSIQCMRRFYETHFVQVFAKTSHINLSHYLVGHFHYFGCITTIIGYSQKMTDASSKSVWLDAYTAIIFLPALVLFAIGWLKQYESNLILANLRRDAKSGSVVNESFGAPFGGWFQHVSSPHRLTEIIIYTSIWILIPRIAYFYIFLWVLANQVETALLAHWWYRETFKNYPLKRKAIFPYIL